MSKRTIYVKDADESTFEEALSFFGEDNVSRLIIDALKTYIAAKRAEEEIILEVGVWPPRGASNTRKIAFKGRLLSKATVFGGQTSNSDDRGVDWALYQTAKGKYLLWWKNWSRWQGESTTADYVVLEELPTYGMVCCGELWDDISQPVPGELIEKAADVLGRDTVQHLEI